MAVTKHHSNSQHDLRAVKLNVQVTISNLWVKHCASSVME